jgi:hypothetical protein
VALTPSEVGARAEREVAYALDRCGWTVYVPLLAPHARVDLIAARGAELLRIQCKNAVLRNQAVAFRPFSNTGNVPKGYAGEIDVFGVYAPELERVFIVPADVPATTCCYLRLEPAKSGQQKGTRLAADFELRRPG